MRRLLLTCLVFAALPVPLAGAQSWSLKGSPRDLARAADELKAQGEEVQRRRHSLLVHGVSRGQVESLPVLARRSVPVKLAQDPVIPSNKWMAWNGLMGTEEAWSSGRGEGALVAVIDSGIDLTHPDLRDRLWTNPGEIAGNGIDDDGNGYKDDVNGVSILSPAPPQDKNGHGTHVAGIIAASLNGFGVNGVAPEARIMPIAALDASGNGSSADIDEGIRYAVANGAQIINISVTSDRVTVDDQAAVDEAERAGVLIVGAAGNEGKNLNGSRYFPVALDNDNVISVGAIDNGGVRAKFSNYGKSSVDLAAFGDEVPSTWNGGRYALLSGTSMASPMVAGSAAVIAGLYPGRGALEWKQALTQSVVSLGSLPSYFRRGGTVNLPAALAWQSEQSGEPLSSTAVRFRSVQVRSRKSGSRRNLRVSWSLTGAGAESVSSVRVSAQGKSRTTSSSSASLARLRRGTITVRLVALDQAGQTAGQASFRLRLR